MELAAWLILLLPLISSGLIGMGAFRSKAVSAGFSIGAVTCSFLLSLSMVANVETLNTSINWLAIEGLKFDIGLQIDKLSKLMLCVVTGVGSLIHIFSLGYMKDDKDFSRYFGFLSLFIFSMLGIILADNFVMMFILILSFVTRNIINIPLIWIIEMAQFVMTGYYLLGGGYSLLSDDHVRMDLIYSRLKDKTKAMLDMITSIFLITYLVILLIGAYSSLQYTIQTNQRLFTAWAPYVWPIKTIMLFGILLMLLQSISIFFKDFAKTFNLEIK